MDHYADFSAGPVTVIYPEQIKGMRKIAELNKNRKRYRICAHSDPTDILQEMYICAKDEGYIPVYQHPETPTTHFIINGTIALVIFDKLGNIVQVSVLDKDKGALSCRINQGIYYMTYIITEWADYLECKSGAFTEISNRLAPWTPEVDDVETVLAFMKYVDEAVHAECDRLNIKMKNRMG